jgi:SAM-dependent methyltransferase
MERSVDFGRRSQDYLTHRPGFPSTFFDRIARHIELAGATALDVGTGPGLVAFELAKRGADVVGVDISPQQIAAARDGANALGLGDRARFLVGQAEATRQESDRFDLVTAGQCWIWFDEPRAIQEIKRVLKPGGLLVVAHFSYLSRHSPVAQATEELVLEFNPTWKMANDSGVYPEQIDALVHGGFDLVEQFCYHHEQAFTHEAWRGRIRTCNGVGSGTLPEVEVARFDANLARLLAERFPGEPLWIPHAVWATIVRKP